MEVATHHAIERRLCGVAINLGPGKATVRLETTREMAADARGLVHGGFVFGAADYAAMVAVNDPNVVLGAAECKFVAPVRLGQVVDFSAREVAEAGRRHDVEVVGRVGEKTVFEGAFACFVLERHVLEGSR
ncbi:MAG: MaoC/PaaZ C-terminal domain-containing protein [Acidobacteriota bacterium]|nr:MaoC/PaaZ C-terminal domain-containing protein [Acidobacteriota bacterium]